MRRTGRRSLLRGLGGAAALALAGCLSSGSPGDPGTTDAGTPTGTATPSPTPEPMTTGTEGTTGGTGASGTSTAMDATPATTTAAADLAAWRTTTLTDVRTGERFTVEGFRGQRVLLESFAVWCPVCTAQQEAMARFLEDSDAVAISLNTDPNESAAKVGKHASEHGFDWRYAVSPPEMTRSLVDAFGTVITNPPSAPVVRVCPGGEASLVEGRGSKSAEELADAFGEC